MIDKAAITIKAGTGGNGMVHFIPRRSKVVGPPDGGDGGRGGDVFFVAQPNTTTLAEFRYRRIYEAEDGKMGGSNQKSGVAGNGLYINVPQGTVVLDANSGAQIIDMALTQEPVLIAQGGKGGKGNQHMRKHASHARGPIPWERWNSAEEGKPGEQVELRLELKLIADIGLVGLPNAGKSTLLSVITSAKPKIADYPFTTLEPNLGVWYIEESSFIVADIPGLIEGASEGKGLGKEFLRHIERTRVLIHLTQSVHDYKTIREELGKHNPVLLEKPEIVVLSKTDTLLKEEITKIIAEFKKQKVIILPIASVTHDGLEVLQKAVLDTL